MKIFKYLLIAVLLLTFVGCSKEPEPRTITVVNEVEILVPTKMKRPKINCEFKGEGTMPMAKVLDCLILQKRVIESVTVE